LEKVQIVSTLHLTGTRPTPLKGETTAPQVEPNSIISAIRRSLGALAVLADGIHESANRLDSIA
jgi:hypothetical protein